jgi:hypothetical protein
MKPEAIIVGLAVTAIVFVIKEIFIKQYKHRSAASADIEKEAQKNGITTEEATDKLILEKLAEAMNITAGQFELENGKVVKHGDRISFNSRSQGFVIGDFTGVRNAKIEGYSLILVLRNNNGALFQTPIEYIDVDTILVYER